MDKNKQKLRKRWDNVEHFPNLPNFPHHVHIGNEFTVKPSELRNIRLLYSSYDKLLENNCYKPYKIRNEL